MNDRVFYRALMPFLTTQYPKLMGKERTYAQLCARIHPRTTHLLTLHAHMDELCTLRQITLPRTRMTDELWQCHMLHVDACLSGLEPVNKTVQPHPRTCILPGCIEYQYSLYHLATCDGKPCSVQGCTRAYRKKVQALVEQRQKTDVGVAFWAVVEAFKYSDHKEVRFGLRWLFLHVCHNNTVQFEYLVRLAMVHCVPTILTPWLQMDEPPVEHEPKRAQLECMVCFSPQLTRVELSGCTHDDMLCETCVDKINDCPFCRHPLTFYSLIKVRTGEVLSTKLKARR